MWKEIRKGAPGFWSLDGMGVAYPFFKGEELSFENVSRLFTEMMRML